MPRLFTALKVPEQIALMLSLKKGKLNGARWIEQEDYHITLSFLGDISEMEAEKAICRLEEIEHKPFEICIDCMNIFGSRRPRTLYAGVQTNKELLNLQVKNDRSMRQIGINIQSRKYAPHVTLARLGSVRPRDVSLFMGERDAFASLVFGVNGFGLYSARNSTGGGPYLIEAEFEF